jgi:hypothetical protein
MRLTCPHCSETLTFTGNRPKFCSNCGHLLSTVEGSTAQYDPEAATVPPAPIPSTRIPSLLDADSTFVPPPTGDEGIAPGQRIGNYLLVRCLGQGGMGSVFEAEEATSKTRVALKVVHQNLDATKDAIERFRLEGELASSLAHPRCVFVLGADEDAGRPWWRSWW